MQVAIVGGTGFVGGYLVDALLARGHQPAMLVRKGSESKARRAGECRVVSGTMHDDDALAALVDGCDAVIYNVGILRESRAEGITFEAAQYDGAVRLISAAKTAGLGRALLMSANGVRAGGTPYQDTKYRAEQAALGSGLHTTVFRPSVIFGDPAGNMEIATQLYQDMVRPPIPAIDFFSMLGAHRGPVRMSPVHAADVADAFVAALPDESTFGQTYELGGPDILTWGEMIETVARAVGRGKLLLPMPIEVMKLAAALLDWLPLFPVTRDQLTMLAEGNTADPGVISALIGRSPRAFTSGSLSYLRDR
ncbi:MAG: NAD(P)H-binding protein [Pseudomonadota bacterium]